MAADAAAAVGTTPADEYSAIPPALRIKVERDHGSRTATSAVQPHQAPAFAPHKTLMGPLGGPSVGFTRVCRPSTKRWAIYRHAFSSLVIEGAHTGGPSTDALRSISPRPAGASTIIHPPAGNVKTRNCSPTSAWHSFGSSNYPGRPLVWP